MKRLFLLLACFASTGLTKVTTDTSSQTSVAQIIAAYKLNNATTCSPDRNFIERLIKEMDIPPMPGAGKYQWKISTTSDSAQFYFNQGINMYYGFHIIESLASFKKAAKFDAENPMIWWAQAVAYGPNINDVTYTTLPEALEAVSRANLLLQKASSVEKDLIRAICLRYSPDTTQTRETLNRKYTAAMKSAYEKNLGNADVAALYADAMMLEHPWDLWNVNGTPKPWTPLIREVLEKQLTITPEHPGLNHYYIHVMEPSPFPEKALASANRLGKLSPGLAHIVHMPSHIYLRTGQYSKGLKINEEAIDQYRNYLSKYPPVAGSEFLYRLHNEHMLINCAMHAGRKMYSIEHALSFQKSIAALLSEPGAMGNYLAYIYMIPTLTMIRFEDWDALINAPAIDSSHVYASLLSHFGKGMALANTGSISKAKTELTIVKELRTDTVLALPFAPFSPAVDGAVIAENMLEGTIALKSKEYSKAIEHFNNAVGKEKAMTYNEPRDWLLNPKYYLADAYFKAAKYRQAEKIFQEDLNDNNENVWSLAGLYKTLEKQNKHGEAGKVAIRLKKAASGSDVHF